MSDRPMRLKYLTKMKIILCIFLLCITAVNVFGQSQELNGIVGKSIKFPTKVETSGNLIYGSTAIGRVISGALNSLNEYQGRVHWESSTGLFSLSGLRLEDSGVYTVQNSDEPRSVSFNLTVWIPVSKPHVSVTGDEYPCPLLCAVERGTEVTLSWYREGEKNPYVTSPVESAPHLNMTVPVESGTYTCETKNSVSRQTSDPLTVGAHCTAPSGFNTGKIVLVTVLVVDLIAVLIYLLFCSSARFSTVSIVFVTVLVVDLIAVLIYLLFCSSARSSTWTIVLVSFLIVVLIADFIIFCIRSKHPAVRRIIRWLCGVSKRSDELEDEPPQT